MGTMVGDYFRYRGGSVLYPKLYNANPFVTRSFVDRICYLALASDREEVVILSRV